MNHNNYFNIKTSNKNTLLKNRMINKNLAPIIFFKYSLD